MLLRVDQNVFPLEWIRFQYHTSVLLMSLSIVHPKGKSQLPEFGRSARDGSAGRMITHKATDHRRIPYGTRSPVTRYRRDRGPYDSVRGPIGSSD
eukprot:768540-Hanusia_phi.AAC.1